MPQTVSLGNYLPKRKGVSAYISDVYAYISNFANGPEKGNRYNNNIFMIYLSEFAQVITKGAVLMHFESIWSRLPV